jgi:hypothetical protein
MRIAVLHDQVHLYAAPERSGAMQWFEAIARALLIAVVVLTGAAVVRNVTDALTAATHVTTLERTAQR